MCKLLNYSYGRKYYEQSVNYNQSALGTYPSSLVGYVFCGDKYYPRRSLRAAADAAADVLAEDVSMRGQDGLGDAAYGPRVLPDITPESNARRRSLYSPAVGFIDIPKSVPYACRIFPGPCAPSGPLVGIECSHTPMAAAKPPPPRPPRPPPAPPAVSNFIRLVNVEPNLCMSNDTDSNERCPSFGRVELQVPQPNKPSSKIWAPLCAPQQDDLFFSLSSTVCDQLFDWPKPNDGGVDFVLPEPGPRLTIPQGPVTVDGMFDPTDYGGWVTVTSSLGGEKAIQDMRLQVTRTPCTRAGLLAVRCWDFSSGLPEWPNSRRS